MLPNGVRPRGDGEGDGWAGRHRTELGNRNYLSDLDGIMGIFYHNTGNRLFVEYQPDAFERRHDPVRRFAYVAIIDRKASMDAADMNKLSAQMYCDICRKLSEHQPLPCRFFQAVDAGERIFGESGESKKQAYVMVEYDIHEGNEVGRHELLDDMRDLWKVLGLTQARDQLANWLKDEGITRKPV